MVKNCFELAVETEGIGFQLEDIQNLLELFWDHFSAETENIDPTVPSTTKLFLARLPMLNSLFSSIVASLVKVDKELKVVTDEVYAAVKGEGNGTSTDAGFERLTILYNVADAQKRETILAFASGLV